MEKWLILTAGEFIPLSKVTKIYYRLDDSSISEDRYITYIQVGDEHLAFFEQRRITKYETIISIIKFMLTRIERSQVVIIDVDDLLDTWWTEFGDTNYN